MPSVFALRWRIGLVLLGGAGFVAPAAHASSFVTVAPPTAKTSSSFVVLGAEPPKPVEQDAARLGTKPRSALDAPPNYAWEPAPVQISPSVIAFGAPAVEQTKVASIGTREPEAKPPETKTAEPKTAQAAAPRPRPAALPKVIRAGVKGHAFPDYVTPPPAAPSQPAAPDPLAPPPSEPPPSQPGQTPAAPPPSARDPEPAAKLQ